MTHFRTLIPVALAVAFAALVPTFAAAQDSKTDGVFQIVKATENRVWRLNTQTGEIAVCELTGANMVCTTTSDAASAPKKSYEQIEAKRAAEKAAAEKEQADRRERELKFLDRILAFIRELIQTALGNAPSS